MNKKFKSISWKIWYSMAGTIVILLLLVLIANVTIFGQVRNEFIFEQLEESAKAKSAAEKTSMTNNITQESFWVAHYRVDIVDGSPNVFMDKFTKSIYQDEHREFTTIELITREIMNNKDNDEGYIREKGATHYYFVDWDDDKKGAMVFLTSTSATQTLKPEIFIIILLLLLISYFASRHAAKKIAKPIQELELFAEEVAKKNWNAVVPKTDKDEIGLLANTLLNMKDSLRESEERERNFLQSTSHDLKTPVMIIKGYAQAIIDGIEVNSEKSPAETIKMESERLERKITQLLRLNTISHTLEMSKKDLIRIDRLINSLVRKFKIIRPDLKWKLNLMEVEIEGDSESIHIAFENIIENQIRYARSEVSILMISDDHHKILISNDGPKFKVDPSSLFDVYQKDRQGNFGLGLAIVKQVINYHSGEIHARNTKTGIEFEILLKAKKADVL